MRPWLRSALFRSYLRRFLVLWVAGKIANGATAAVAGLAPLAFRPGTELVICATELGILATFIRRVSEDVLLGNVGLRLSVALSPLVVVHMALSAALALLT